MNEAIRLENVLKQYPPRTRAINGVSMRVAAGERVCVSGAPSSGKTTLLRLIAGIEPVSSGSVFVFGTPLHALDNGARADFRNAMFGIIGRKPALFGALSVAENAALPLLIRGVQTAKSLQAARVTLDALGIAHLFGTRSVQLTPVEACLAAIARALVTEPKILLLDEPYADLSERDAQKIADRLDALGRSGGCTMLYFAGAPNALPIDKKFILHYGELREDKQ